MNFKSVYSFCLGGNVLRIALATSFKERLVGMMGKSRSRNFDFLIFENCNAIHTFGMTESIRIIFLNKELNIVKEKNKLAPWRTLICTSASYAIEGPPYASKHTQMESDFVGVWGAGFCLENAEIINLVRAILKTKS